MSVPAPTVEADIRASLGKSIDNETNNRLVDDRAEKAAMVKDARSMEDAVGEGDAWTGKTPDELAADPDALEKMSERDILKAMGLEISDKSDSDAPEGDAPVHEIDAALEEGRVTAYPEEGTAAPAAAPAQPTANAQPAAPAQADKPAAQPTQSSTDDLYVESRNGQGRIRYEVLQNERERRQAAEAELAELRRQLAERNNAAPATAEPAATPAAQPATSSQPAARPAAVRPYTEAEIAAMRERFDDAIVDMLVENRRVAVDAYERALRAEAVIAERDSRSLQDQVQDFIDQDPLLSRWQSGKEGSPEHALWTEAVATDDMLRALPAWQNKPWQERFAEATRRVAIAHGIEIPNSRAAGANTPARPSLQDRAAAALQAASGHVQLPVSHSDLPAGTPPAQSDRDSIAGLSITDLYARMETMTPEQVEAWLARVA